MKKMLGIANGLLVIAICIGNYYFTRDGGLLVKGLCSGAFALIGLLNTAYALSKKVANRSFYVWMSLGFVFAMLGDIYLGFSFVLGAALFAAGHLLYFVAYTRLSNFCFRDVLVCGVLILATGCFILFFPYLNFDPAMFRYVCLAYAVIISLMVGKAVSSFLGSRKDILRGLLAVGSFLFMFSDFMLVLNWFMDCGSWSSKLCMATYYPAQCILAVSLYVSALRAEKR